MTKRSRAEDRQRAKAAKQAKLVSVLVVVFLVVMVFQFTGAPADVTTTTISVSASADTAVAPEGAPQQAAETAPLVDLPQMELAEMLAADPFIKPEEAIALEPPPAQIAPVEAKVEVPVRAVYGNSRGAVALIGRDVVAEGERILPSIEISRISPGRVTVRRDATGPAGLEENAER